MVTVWPPNVAPPARQYDAVYGVRVSSDKGPPVLEKARTGGGQSHADGRPSGVPCPSTAFRRVGGTLPPC